MLPSAPQGKGDKRLRLAAGMQLGDRPAPGDISGRVRTEYMWNRIVFVIHTINPAFRRC